MRESEKVIGANVECHFMLERMPTPNAKLRATYGFHNSRTISSGNSISLTQRYSFSSMDIIGETAKPTIYIFLSKQNVLLPDGNQASSFYRKDVGLTGEMSAGESYGESEDNIIFAGESASLEDHWLKCEERRSQSRKEKTKKYGPVKGKIGLTGS
ncbi:unnamed protein product [Allacma fusca]|uniref:Uncharacterized protein n=1 Tax=Allacma fusca TaxID=39272 RepID=A0A8J2KU89_9HEXA|nr:unnamed protein product [Allacma fusca]